MDDLRTIPDRGKLSPELATRLVRLRPHQRLRAIVLLNSTHTDQSGSGKRPSRAQRQAMIEEIRDSASTALAEIDTILSEFDGRRLTDTPTALGTICVESNSAGIAALSKSEYVKAILQDQPVSRVS